MFFFSKQVLISSFNNNLVNNPAFFRPFENESSKSKTLFRYEMTAFPGVGIIIIDIRQSWDRIIFTTGIFIADSSMMPALYWKYTVYPSITWILYHRIIFMGILSGGLVRFSECNTFLPLFFYRVSLI